MDCRDTHFQPFECISSTGLTIRGSYHGSAASHAPVVIICHGFTGQRFGPGYIFVKISRALADAGVASLRFDFTGAGESEGSFSNMNTATMLADCATVASEVYRRFSPDKLILCGHSFGGMIAARSAGNAHACGLILLSPVGDPSGLIHRRKMLLDAGPNDAGFYENGPHEMSISFLDSLRGFDPVADFEASYSGKLLLIQGDRDLSITVDESYRYITAAQKKSVPTAYHLLQGSDHNYSRVSDVTMVTTTVVSWIKEHFGE
jgi:uncharacterized protein